ncbi:mersacidin family lantibiotic [Arcanobacterium pinnipediorum]|uniref:mersacidin family lantibiotic n=1 Tax=Arcanobacterium pinnipediorum TaxID=1503041 RepID=UPI00338F846C
MNSEHFGASFTELTQEEMDFITGANGSAQPHATPTVTTSSFPCINITTSSWVCISGGVSALSGLVSYTKRCI